MISMSDEVRKFRVVRIESDIFTIDDGTAEYNLRARKSIRKTTDIRVGDFVTVSADDNPVIESVLPRKNFLIRPAVANVDTVIIVVAPHPEPDFITADKLVVNCRLAGISPVICVNKNDIPFDLDEVTAQYGDFADGVISCSAAGRDVRALEKILFGKLSALAGQSAVGKSSLVNALTGLSRETGDLSAIGRGKNTTTRAEIVRLRRGTYIIDTPGFSMLDMHGADARGLANIYGYSRFSDGCRFGGGCTHTAEPDCAVRAAASRGETSEARYVRYVRLYRELSSLKKYGR